VQTGLSKRIQRLLCLIVCGYASALSFGITFVYLFLIVGIAFSLILFLLSASSANESEVELQQSGRPPRFDWGPLSVPLAAYALATAISGLGAPCEPAQNPYAFGDFIAALSTLRPFIVYFWAFDLFSKFPKMRIPALICLLVTSACGGILAAIQQLCHWHPWGAQFLQGTGFLKEPMAFSGVMQIFSLLSLAILVVGAFESFPKPFNNRVIFALLTAANVLGLIFASERSAWLGFASGALIGAAIISWRLAVVAFLGMCGSAPIGWFCVPMVQARLAPMLPGHHDPGTEARWQVWKIAYEKFLRSVITGVGATRFPQIRIPGATDLGKDYLAHAHSNILQILATTGLIGFCTYIWIIVQSLRVACKQFALHSSEQSPADSVQVTETSYAHMDCNIGERGIAGNQLDGDWQKASVRQTSEPKMERAIALGAIGAVISLTAAGLFEYNFGTGQVRLSLWFLLAMLACDTKYSANVKARARQDS
jgi:O-antigen ligase